MRNPKRLTAIIIILAMLIALLPIGLKSEDTIYSGISNGDAIIKNASFTDIAGNANADNILRMAAYSIVNEYGSTKYRPNDFATRQDVLAGLVRTMGKQEEAVTLGEDLKRQNPKLTTVESYILGHIEAAKKAGVITTAEIDAMAVLTKAEVTAVEKEVAAIAKKNWKMTKLERDQLLKSMKDQASYNKALRGGATREETALWTARALGMAPIKGEKTMEVYGYKDWKSIGAANLPYIEAVNRSGILKGETTANYNPKGKIKRGDLASILSRATAETMPALGFTTGYGKVEAKAVTNDVQPYNQTTTTDIVLGTPGAEKINIKAVTKTTKNTRTAQSIPVIKNGKMGNESLIQKDDIVEYTMTKDNKVQLLQIGKLKELKGKFLSYSPELNTVQMADLSGKKYQFQLMPNTVVTAQKVPIDISKAEENLSATAIYDGNTIRALDLDVPADRVNNEEMAVKILFADPLGRVLKIADENDDRQYLQLAEDAVIYINEELQGIEAIGYDQDAVLKVAGDQVMEVRVYTDIPDGQEGATEILTGRIRELSGNNLSISPDSDPEGQHSYILENDVPIIKDRKSVNKYNLKPGDRVKLHVDSDLGGYISRVEVQGGGVKVENLYKGDIKEVLPSTGEVILSNVYTYGYHDWVKQGDYIKYKVADAAKLYKGNDLLDMKKLKDNVGKTIYAASIENFGDEEIVQGILKDGTENALYKKLNDVKYTANQLTLSDGRILGYTKGAIIIKDGKLMDTSDLKKNTAAFVIQNKGTGMGTAPIISLDSFNGLGGYSISKGYLNKMGEDYFTMEGIFKLSSNSWESSGDSTYHLSDDTYIYDNILLHSVISADKFAESRFKPYTYTWPNYANASYGKEFHEDDQYHRNYSTYNTHPYYHVHSALYAVTDEYGNAVAINIYAKDKDLYNPNKINKERMATGQIVSIDSDNNMMTINKAMEFSPLYQEWRPVTVSIPVDTTGAMLLKDGKPVQLSDFSPGESVYTVSIDGNAILILAE